MKLVINKCYGGFSISPKAMKRMAELQGRKCYFHRDNMDSAKSARAYYRPIPDKEAFADKNVYGIWAFDVPDIMAVLPKPKSEAGWRKYNAVSNKHYIPNRPEDRADPALVQAVEELGEAADGACAKLAIVTIPDGVKYSIEDYDGHESVHEKHREWS